MRKSEEKVKKLHPDGGGSEAAFRNLQRAWEEFERQNAELESERSRGSEALKAKLAAKKRMQEQKEAREKAAKAVAGDAMISKKNEEKAARLEELERQHEEKQVQLELQLGLVQLHLDLLLQLQEGRAEEGQLQLQLQLQLQEGRAEERGGAEGGGRRWGRWGSGGAGE